MPPKKSRDQRSTAPTPSPAPRSTSTRASRSARSRSQSGAGSSTDGEGVVAEGSKGVGETLQEEEEDEEGQDQEQGDEAAGGAEDGEQGGEEEIEDEAEEDNVPDQGKGKGKEKAKTTLEERMEKMRELRLRMNQSSAANRKDLVTDHQKRQVTAKELARLEKQKKLAQTLRLKEEAEANGEDMERKKAWEWSIEQDERWKKKMDEREERSDNRYHNAEDDSYKRYDRNIRNTKADLLAYERQKEAALGLAPGTLVPVGASTKSIAQQGGSSSKGLTLAEDLYRGADTLSYGDSKPSEEAIDRLTAKINNDMDKGKKRNRPKKDEETDVTYINDRNKVFNRKLVRYFDKYTKEIRANFERGTAL